MQEVAIDHIALQTPAFWHPDAPREDAVVLFRRRLALGAAAGKRRFFISASQRFIVYVDGEIIARGPARSDEQRWGLVEVTLPADAKGSCQLAIMVVHRGDHAGIGQLGGAGFLLLASNHKDLHAQLSDQNSWRCHWDRSLGALQKHAWGVHTPYFAIGKGDDVDARAHPWGWELGKSPRGFDWVVPKVCSRAAGNIWGNLPLKCRLVHESLPPMQEKMARFARVARQTGLPADASPVLDGSGKVTIPPNRSVEIVFDFGELVNAYPALQLSGGAGATLEAVSAEAPYREDDRRHYKLPRHHSDEGTFLGARDRFMPDGGRLRSWMPWWFRSFRYWVLRIKTGKQALHLHDLACQTTAFPLKQVARFRAAGRTDLKQVWDVSWRTIVCCAHETFFDCPHYEQAQFPGDTRIQAVYHYLVGNDDRLAMKAIDDFHASRLPMGLTQCRYPSRAVQILPTFSLAWVGMLRDAWWYRGHTEALAHYLPFARETCAWFWQQRRDDGLLGHIGHAPFIDWCGFTAGNAPQAKDGGSAILTSILATACGYLAELETVCGHDESAKRWQQRAKACAKAVRAHCYQADTGLVADYAGAATTSVHAQVLAVLAGALTKAQGRRALQRAIDADDCRQPGTLYFRYFQWRAWQAVGKSEAFWDMLPTWLRVLDGSGLTTWPEGAGDSRSDCHAWSVLPGIAMMECVLGVVPAAPGYAAVRLQPQLGPLDAVKGVVPTPHGPVKVAYQRTDAGLSLDLQTPVPVELPNGKRCKPGKQTLTLRA